MPKELFFRRNDLKTFGYLFLAILISVSTFAAFRINNANAATTLTVNSTLDSTDQTPGDGSCDDGLGNCTLRAAIMESNALSGTDTINFGIAPFDGNVKTIQPAYDYDLISDTVIIDGYTQDTATPNTAASPNPFDGTLLVEIDGTNANNGFTFTGGASGGAGSTIKGLVINRFANNGIGIDAQNIKVEGNYIGTDADGLSGLGNQVGVSWEGSGDHDDGKDATIGGLLPAQRNIISGNDNGSFASGSYPTNGWVFEGNYIGVDALGTSGIGNATAGGSGSISIDICSDVVIGGSVAGSGNVISGNLSHGLAPDTVTNLTIQGNLIGTDYTGTVALGNGAGGLGGAGITAANITGIIGGDTALERNVIANSPGDGIYLNDVQGLVIQGNYIGTGINGTEDFPNGQNGIAMNNGSSGNLIGGINSGEGNIIVNSDQAGIVISDNSDGTTSNSILGNSVFNNTQLGIDLTPQFGITENDANDADAGANDLLNFPDNLTYDEGSSDTVLDFELDVPAGDYRIEFFSNSSPDASGNGEGEIYLGHVDVTSSGAGAQNYSYTLVGQTGLTNISSTATQIDGLSSTGFSSTSEFSDIAVETLPDYGTTATKTLLNPELVALDTDIVYRFEITNDGPTSFDLTTLDGNSPGTNSLILDVLPPELTYINQNNSDVACADFADGSAFGPLLENHSDWRLINCGYTGPSLILSAGDSFIFDMTVHVEPTSDLVFTNYAFSSAPSTDPDYGSFVTAFGNGTDIIDSIGGQNGNFPAAEFPIPVAPTETTTIPSPGTSGSLSATGFQIETLFWSSISFIILGAFVAIRSKKRFRY